MPDFERLTRSLELYLCTYKSVRREKLAYFKGQDNARWQVVGVVVAFVMLAVLVVLV